MRAINLKSKSCDHAGAVKPRSVDMGLCCMKLN